MIEPYRGPFLKSKKDPKFTGHLLIAVDMAPDHEQFPKINETMTPPGTFYRFDTVSKRVTTMVTVMPDNTHVVWFTCGACSSEIHNCRCGNGISAPRSIEYIFDSTNAHMAGEEWTVHHPNYNGSMRKAARGASRPHWETGGQVVRRPVRKAAEGPSKPHRTLQRHKPQPEPQEIDLAKVDKAAAASAEEQTKELERRLSKPQKKSKLKRKK